METSIGEAAFLLWHELLEEIARRDLTTPQYREDAMNWLVDRLVPTAVKRIVVDTPPLSPHPMPGISITFREP